MLFKRIDQGGQESPQCIDFVYRLMLTYNHTVGHSSIQMTPYEATKPSNAIDATSTIELQDSFTRQYPELELGSRVNVYHK